MRRQKKIKSKIVFYLMLWTSVIILLFSFFLFKTAENYIYQELSLKIKATAALINDRIDPEVINALNRENHSSSIQENLTNTLKRLKTTANLKSIEITDTNFKRIASTEDFVKFSSNFIMQQDIKEILELIKTRNETVSQLYYYKDEVVLNVYSPIILNDEVKFILKAEGSAKTHSTLKMFRENVLIFTAIFLGITLVVSNIFALFFTNPLKKLVQGAELISKGQYGKTISIKSNDELGILSSKFNEMSLSVKQKDEDLKAMHTIAKTKAAQFELYNLNIIESISSGIIVTDTKDKITLSNKAVKNIFNLTIESGEKFEKLKFGKFRGKELLNFKEKKNFEIEIDGKIIECFYYNLTDSFENFIGRIFLFMDLTEIRELQKKVALKDKLAALGKLSAGVAHEIRNPLGGISGFIELLERKVNEEKQLTLIKKIKLEISHLNKIVEDFLIYAKPGQLDIGSFEINELIESAQNITRFESKKIDFILNAEHKSILCDFYQLRQVFINLFKNAAEAASEVGIITIDSEIKNECYILTVKDNGCGIKKDVLNKIFQPFFSAKAGGTGMGLAVAYSILSNHNFAITAESDGKSFSIFKIIIPESSISK